MRKALPQAETALGRVLAGYPRGLQRRALDRLAKLSRRELADRGEKPLDFDEWLAAEIERRARIFRSIMDRGLLTPVSIVNWWGRLDHARAAVSERQERLQAHRPLDEKTEERLTEAEQAILERNLQTLELNEEAFAARAETTQRELERRLVQSLGLEDEDAFEETWERVSARLEEQAAGERAA